MKILCKRTIVSLLICSVLSLNISGSDPIAYMNTLGYSPAQIETAESNNGMVSTQHFLATRVGEKILNKGGNAYDASIAIAFTLAVVLPRAGNIGGGGFMVMYDKETEKSYSIDYREKAPLLSTKDMYLNQDGSFNDQMLSTFGYLSIGVPGTVAGLWDVHKKFGSLPWSVLLEDAINLAEKGFEITPFLADILFEYNEKLSFFNETKNIFQVSYPNFEGKLLIQTDLAKTLKIISEKGRDGFYKGSVANKIAKAMKDNNGLITKSDLENYNPVWRKPLISKYRGNNVITMGPPSSGGLHIIQMLNILENYDLKEVNHNSKEYINLLTEVMKYAYSDRSKYLGDPDFYDVPVEKITSKKYGKRIFNDIEIGQSKPVGEVKPGMYLETESHETTHFSVADSDGNIVSSTYTLNSTFGSGVVIKGTGIVMNNEMDDFSAAPGIPNQFNLLGAEANEIAPNKRPLSSMTPTIVMKNNELFFTTGSPGGSRIISAVLQSILNIIDFDMNLEETTKARRIHHQWFPDILEVEYSLDNKTRKELEDMNYSIVITDPLTCLQLIMYKDKKFYGYGDFRRVDAYASGEIND
ncbi:MAG: gamma-glutamyltransferase [Gammaproteobacteria bacterium]|tara:strand:- start:937 stop:2685 length:1749 start_codon:yes stop_codon:yes gene_type:complete